MYQYFADVRRKPLILPTAGPLKDAQPAECTWLETVSLTTDLTKVREGLASFFCFFLKANKKGTISFASFVLQHFISEVQKGMEVFYL